MCIVFIDWYITGGSGVYCIYRLVYNWCVLYLLTGI